MDNGKRLRIRARAVVLAGGAIPTPLMLLGQGLCNSSGQVGRNLTIHPSAAVSALFDEDVNGATSIPQGYGTKQFLDEGLLLSTALGDHAIFPATVAAVGRRLMEAVELREKIAGLGVLAKDQGPGGRVWRKVGGRVAISYNLTGKDIDLLHRGMNHAIDIFRAAGARRYYPLLAGHPVLDTEADVARFREQSFGPRDFVLTSFHPLGTCKMGQDPRTSVVGLDHQAHDLPGLFVVDGSSLPGSPSVNPQIAIMAAATRAADKIYERLT
jgi:hypothetical protein